MTGTPGPGLPPGWGAGTHPGARSIPGRPSDTNVAEDFAAFASFPSPDPDRISAPQVLSGPPEDLALEVASRSAPSDEGEAFDGPPDAGLFDDFGLPEDTSLPSIPGRAAPAAPAPADGWQIRKESGKTFGPFDDDTVLDMLSQGHIDATVTISRDGKSWAPIDSHPPFASAVGVPSAAARGRVPPPVIAPSGAPEPAEEESAPGTVPLAERLAGLARRLSPRPRGRAGKLLGLVALLVILAGAGLYFVGDDLDLPEIPEFITNLLSGSSQKAAAAPKKTEVAPHLDAWARHAAEGSFAGWQKAMASAREALAASESSIDAHVAYVLAASALKRGHGEAGAELDRAHAAAVGAVRENSVEAKIIAAALALSKKGEAVNVQKQLAELEDDPRALLLRAEAFLVQGEFDRVAERLDRLAGSGETPALLLLRAELARAQQDVEAEAAALIRVEEISPGHVRAKLLLARLHAAQQRVDEAVELLSAVLAEPAVHALSPREEAQAFLLHGDLLAGKQDIDAATAAYKRAAERAPSDPAPLARLGRLLLRLHRYEAAVPVLAQAVERARADVELLTANARAQMETGGYVPADQSITRALEEDPKNPGALVMAGVLARRLAKKEEGLRRFQEALSHDAKFAPAMVALGRAYLEDHEPKRAKEWLEKAATIAPESAEAQTAWGNWLLTARRSEEARKAFAQAIASEPLLAEGHAGLAQALSQQGDAEAARKSFMRAIELDEGLVEAREGIAVLHWRAGQLDEALEQLRKALQHAPKESRLHALVGAVHLEAGRDGEADLALRTALTHSDDDATTHHYYGRLLHKRGLGTKSLEHLRRATELAPLEAEPQFHLGLAYEKAQRLASAADAYRRAAKLDPAQLEYSERLGRVLAAQGLYSTAIAALEKVVEREPQRGDAYAILGECELKAGRVDKALGYLDRAVEFAPENAEAHYHRGRAAERLGRIDQATSSYLEATRLDPSAAMAHFYLGYIFKNKGRKKDAITAFEKYLALRPDARDADEIRDQIYFLR